MSRILTYFRQKTNLLVLCLFISYAFSLNLENHRVLEDVAPIPSKAPQSYDWRDYTAMTPVKNQSDCNAYHAFSTVAFFQQDLILFENASTSIDLSQQFLATCLPNGGCVGGNPKDAMNYVLKQGAIPTQKAYPFSPWSVQSSDICYPPNNVSIKVGTRPMVGFWNVDDQQFLKSLILQQPLNIYICSEDLKTYAPTSNSNRLLSCSASNINNDFSVLLIGYTQTQWIIKNSWGTSWGLGGYGYISRNADNDCCIGSQVFMRGKNTTNCTIQNCDVCVDNKFCSSCKPGYYVSNKNSTQTCTSCNYANCAVCENNVGYCSQCIYGYALYFPEQVCKVSTIANCQSIVNGGCKTCHEGYKVNANFTCDIDCAISNCQVCKSSKSCSTCKAGYNLVYNNSTLSCQKNTCKQLNCATCDSKGKCLSCVGSYQIVEDSCVMVCNQPNCQQCSKTQNICAVCNSGYALDFYSHQCTITNVDNCNETYLTKYCSICQTGYLRSDSWQKCTPICAIENCQTCQTGAANQCTVCKNGYTLKTPANQTIAQCIKNPCNLTNCSLCDAAGSTCVKCIDNYHVWDWSKNACIPYVCTFANCAKCQTNSTQCQQCNNNTVPYIPTGGCTATNITHCVAVGVSQNGTECWNCDTGFQIDYNTWKACNRICNDSICLDCSDSTTFCKKCPDGYAVKNISSTVNQCIKIPTYLPNCLLGNSDQTVCYKCAQFHFFNNKTGNCELNQNCPTNCVKCSSPNQTLACVCKAGMAWDFQNKVCIINPSDASCLVVSNYTGTPQCFQCTEGYSISSDGKGCVSSCSVANCSVCLKSDVADYPNYCQTCIDGYVANLNLTKCLQCQVNFCKTCQGPNQLNICTECKIGYQLNDDGTCTQIPCQKNAVFNGLVCSCSKTYYNDIQTNECKNCIASCERCTTATNCLVCMVGYYLNNGACSPCLQNCQSCSSSNTCEACNQGYTYQIQNGTNLCVEVGLGREGYFVLPNGKKARCSSGCASCAQSQLVCQQCLTGYILSGDVCVKCGDNCQKCYPNILNACTTCDIGFLLVGGNCNRCKSDQCLDCPVQVDICTGCLPGYYVKDQTCQLCGVGCLTCTPDGTCTSCRTGFALLDGGICEQCLDGCAQCGSNSLDQCQGGCISGTYKSGNKCVNCPSICLTCDGADKCTECIPGYNLVSGVCQQWCTDSNCFDCSGNSSYCKQCYAGYEASNGECVQDLTCNNSTKQGNTTTTTNGTTTNGTTTTNETTTTNGTTTTNETTTTNGTTTTNETTTTNGTTTTNETTTTNGTTTTNETTTTNGTTTTNETTTTNGTTTNGTTTNETTTTNGTTTNGTTTNGTTTNGTTTNGTTTNGTTTNGTTAANETTTNGTITTSGAIIATCEVCPKKYYLSSNFSCLPCTTTDPNCIACNKNAPQNCTQCAVSYYLNDNATCAKCADNCLTCRSQQYCYICRSGFYMVQKNRQYTGDCAVCDSNCLTCIDTPKKCLSCKPGFLLSVSNFCMNQEFVKYYIRLNMPFNLFSKQLTAIRKEFNLITKNKINIYKTQVFNASSGSTKIYGSVDCQNTGSCEAYDLLKASINAGSYINNYQVMQFTLDYNGNKYDSQPNNNSGDSSGGVKGWVIAVIVVGSVVGLILTIIIITCIIKKVKKNRQEKQTEENQKEQYDMKETEHNIKKENPQLK